MPLSPPVEREAIHQRDIECHGYRRSDGWWDVEGRMVDTKTYAFDNRYRGQVEPGVPVHEMWIRMTLDDRLQIHGIEAVTDHHPFPNCPDIAPDYGAMVGTRIRPGWTRLVKEKLGQAQGCTHLTRLLQELAVVAIQTIYPRLSRDGKLPQSDRRPPHIDSCHALRSDGPVVKELYPKWYRS
jgi:hypothetical protein